MMNGLRLQKGWTLRRLGLLGMLCLVVLIESAVGRHEPPYYTQIATENWKESERQAREHPSRG